MQRALAKMRLPRGEKKNTLNVLALSKMSMNLVRLGEKGHFHSQLNQLLLES